MLSLNLGTGPAKGQVKGGRCLPGQALGTETVNPVGGDLKLNHIIVQAKDLPDIPAQAGIPGQDIDPVFCCIRKIGYCVAKLLYAAKHALGGDTADLAPLDLAAISQDRPVQGNRDNITLGQVSRPGDNVQLLFSQVNLADKQPVSIRMWPDGADAASDDLFYPATGIGDAFHLGAAQC